MRFQLVIFFILVVTFLFGQEAPTAYANSIGNTNINFSDDCILRDSDNEEIIYGGLIGAIIDIE